MGVETRNVRKGRDAIGRHNLEHRSGGPKKIYGDGSGKAEKRESEEKKKAKRNEGVA